MKINKFNGNNKNKFLPFWIVAFLSSIIATLRFAFVYKNVTLALLYLMIVLLLLLLASEFKK